MVKLGHRQVFAFPPFAAAVVRVPHSAIVAYEHDLCVGWIDPHIVRVAVSSHKTANHRKTFPAVFADDQSSITLEDAVRIFWINNQLRKVQRAPYHPLALATPVPRHPAVL